MPSRPLSVDPSRTVGLRRTAVAELRRRFAALARSLPADPTAMRDYLREAGARRLTEGEGSDDYWMTPFLRTSYGRGIDRAFVGVRSQSPEGGRNPLFRQGAKDQFRDIISGGEGFGDLDDLSRTGMQSILDHIRTKASQAITKGRRSKKSAKVIRDEVTAEIRKALNVRAIPLVMDGIVGAAAEGQLDAFQARGITKVKVDAELVTAGDDRVCPKCAPLEGKVYSIRQARGVIPLHPRCRCAWRPVVISSAVVKPDVPVRRGKRKAVKPRVRQRKARPVRKPRR